MTDLAALTRRNQQRWDAMKLTRPQAFLPVARRLCGANAKATYQRIAQKTGVPWFAIAVIHEREASQNFNRQLGQGDPLGAKSIHDPKGRGPFAGATAFEDAAYDALVRCGPYAARWTDWSAGGLLTLLEQYNGLGYASKGMASPYVWSGTDQYVSGKYVADHVFDPNTIDVQLGCAGLLRAMMGVDASIAIDGHNIAAPTVRVAPGKVVAHIPSPSIVPSQAPAPSITHPAPGSIGAFVAKIFEDIFGGGKK